ncbi:MAG: primosomal protein N' [Lentisphaeria bacterium]|nr:primosomal protein N' [Lentisphaeria bacterium]
MIAKVVTDVSLDREFDYLVPAELESAVRVGMSVDLRFGRSKRTGYVLALAEQSSYPAEKLRPLDGISTERAHIPENLISLGRWMAEYYCCSQEQAIRTLLPSAVRSGKVRAKSRRIYYICDREGAEKFLAENADAASAAQRCAVLRALLPGGLALEQLRLVPDFSRSSLSTLMNKALVAVKEELVRREPWSEGEVLPDAPLELNEDQKKALARVDEIIRPDAEKRVILLHGVTNSGKTEVYLQAIAKVIGQGRTAIVLVPEISLTPQTVRRFRARFGDRLSVLHSRLSDGERFDEWNRINAGEVRIVVGARSALFAPVKNLGLVIVDEEHESTYKQSEAPRYMARDVAVMRGQMEKAGVILGSATPSAESMYNAACGKFILCRMPRQVAGRPAPLMHVVDMRLQPAPEPGKSAVFSAELLDAVRQRVEQGEQCILFLNRRGYARVMHCEQCGFDACCPECSRSNHPVNYVYSRSRATLSCHLCGSVVSAYEKCPECGSPDIRYSGTGTEKLEAMARGAFSFARIARMDSDAMKSNEDYEEVLERFRRGDVDILIGTQMIAKGLHFPNVTLVGIINADQGLSMPDFRAPERTFQLITQVAGRAGRGNSPGEVIVQTRQPDNDAIACAVNFDFDGFSEYDLEFRKMLDFPPFTRLIAVHFRGEDEEAVRSYGEEIVKALSPYVLEGTSISAPLPAPIERIKGKFRYVVTIKGRKLKVLRQALRILALHRVPPKGVEMYVDVDAQSIM